jgi:hypothetical protein
MESADTRTYARRRKEQRLGILRRRAALASALGFAAFVALAAQHAVGSTKSAATTVTLPSRTAAAPARYFDEQSSGSAFTDPSAAPLPPVAQTHVS